MDALGLGTSSTTIGGIGSNLRLLGLRNWNQMSVRGANDGSGTSQMLSFSMSYDAACVVFTYIRYNPPSNNDRHLYNTFPIWFYPTGTASRLYVTGYTVGVVDDVYQPVITMDTQIDLTPNTTSAKLQCVSTQINDIIYIRPVVFLYEIA